MTCSGASNLVRAAIPQIIGHWTAQKLEYLDNYLQAYRTATKRAGESYYLDLFAGCGDCVLKKSGISVSGSSWRALSTVPAFTGYFFVEKNPSRAHHLQQSISAAGLSTARVFAGDCNGPALDQVLATVPRQALSFAFLDPSGVQLRWGTVERLAAHRIGPFKMELLILYAYDMYINRFIGTPQANRALTALYGDESWRLADSESQDLGEERQVRRRRFIDLYKEKLRDLGYKYVDDFGPMGHGDRDFYQVIFAGDNAVGDRIMRQVWAKPRVIPGQFGYQPVRRPL